MTDPMKFCRSCKYYLIPWGYTTPQCCGGSGKKDLVTGEPEIGAPFLERGAYGHCGPEGKHWEPSPEPPFRPQLMISDSLMSSVTAQYVPPPKTLLQRIKEWKGWKANQTPRGKESA